MNPDAKLIVYAMANLDNEEDAAIMCLTINMQILRKSMSSPKSMVIVDEVSILVRFEAIAKNISRFCANGLKSGIQMLLSGQDVDSIVQSSYGSQILQNTPVKMVGKIEPMAVNSIDISKIIFILILSPTPGGGLSAEAWKVILSAII